eukprot:GILK01004471.1.p1 GENE.GILK01004471.1~~GILK01004471.1.p1  ORF type:complete len:592 (-),score=29.64 GILK01004471.1:62-1837(-)
MHTLQGTGPLSGRGTQGLGSAPGPSSSVQTGASKERWNPMASQAPSSHSYQAGGMGRNIGGVGGIQSSTQQQMGMTMNRTGLPSFPVPPNGVTRGPAAPVVGGLNNPLPTSSSRGVSMVPSSMNGPRGSFMPQPISSGNVASNVPSFAPFGGGSSTMYGNARNSAATTGLMNTQSMGGNQTTGYGTQDSLSMLSKGMMDRQTSNSMTTVGGAPTGSDDAYFDMEFPSLSSRLQSMSMHGGQAGGGGSDIAFTPLGMAFQNTSYEDMLKRNTNVPSFQLKGQLATTPDFSFQTEDFPALPGFKGGERTATKDEQLFSSQQYQLGGSGSAYTGGQAARGQDSSYLNNVVAPPPQLTSASRQISDTRSTQQVPVGGGQSANMSSSGGFSQNVAMLAPGNIKQVQSSTKASDEAEKKYQVSSEDRFGLMGILGVIKMTDADLSMLALGMDLTTLGLNLNSPECLYATFASPWAEGPSRKEPEYYLPSCYYMQPPALKTSHLHKFQLETLFYIFYNMPRDTLQAYAASELYARDWKFHLELKLWFTRADHVEGAIKGPGNASGWVYFDITSWEKKYFTGTVNPANFMPDEDARVKL